MPSRLSQKIKRFLSREDGPTAVEYAVLLAIIAGTIVASISYVGTEVSAAHETISEAIDDSLNP